VSREHAESAPLAGIDCGGKVEIYFDVAPGVYSKRLVKRNSRSFDPKRTVERGLSLTRREERLRGGRFQMGDAFLERRCAGYLGYAAAGMRIVVYHV